MKDKNQPYLGTASRVSSKGGTASLRCTGSIVNFHSAVTFEIFKNLQHIFLYSKIYMYQEMCKNMLKFVAVIHPEG